MKQELGRLLAERALDGEDQAGKHRARPARSVTVNLAEAPLGWLRSQGHITERPFDAGEQLRLDWERAQLAPSVTMRWDAAPMSRGRGGAASSWQPAELQLRAQERFDAAVAAAGPGLSDILWRVVCAGEGMREAEGALGWPARAGKLVLTIALDRVADFYRMPGSAG
jgi:hypothetical protein